MVNYLGKIIYNKDADPQPYAQLVNVPELQGTLRCRFCRYFEAQRTEDDYYKCRESHRCGYESLLYAPMVNSDVHLTDIDEEHFTPVAITKQHEIDSMKRYLQLWSCDISGYQCCKLCYFYPQRIEKQQTISACANSHDCGQNASFWDLLELKNTLLYEFPYKLYPYTYTAKITFLDGTTTEATPVSLSRDSEGRVLVTLSDGTIARILLVDIYFPSAWCWLRGAWDDPTCFQANLLANFPLPTDYPTIILRCDGELLYEWLLDHYVSYKGLIGSLGYVFRHQYATQHYIYLASRRYASNMNADGNNYLISIDDIGDNTSCYFRFNNSEYYLGATFTEAEPRQWKKIKITGTLPTGTIIINIPSYDSPSANFLRAIGVRDSLFQNL